MILEVLRTLTNWLADPANGVNGYLGTIPLDGLDVAPASVVTVADETRNGFAARGRLPDKVAQLPALLISQGLDSTVAPYQSPGPNGVRDASISVLIRYAVTQTKSQDASQDARYTWRAVQRSLEQFWLDANLEARRMNGIVAWYPESSSLVPMYEPIGDTVATSALHLTIKARDTAP